jgi:hypothetical protein
LRIPFDAIRTFVDPSVEFGLRFESTEMPDDEPEDEPPTPPDRGPDRSAPQDAEVVRLDRFRKNH